mgnify:CR=1 FL=1
MPLHPACPSCRCGVQPPKRCLDCNATLLLDTNAGTWTCPTCSSRPSGTNQGVKAAPLAFFGPPGLLSEPLGPHQHTEPGGWCSQCPDLEQRIAQASPKPPDLPQGGRKRAAAMEEAIDRRKRLKRTLKANGAKAAKP